LTEKKLSIRRLDATSSHLVKMQGNTIRARIWVVYELRDRQAFCNPAEKELGDQSRCRSVGVFVVEWRTEKLLPAKQCDINLKEFFSGSIAHRWSARITQFLDKILFPRVKVGPIIGLHFLAMDCQYRKCYGSLYR
jgi:hypothetical protein